MVMQEISQHISHDRRITVDESDMNIEGSPSVMAYPFEKLKFL
jgi:hypothetical protein